MTPGEGRLATRPWPSQSELPKVYGVSLMSHVAPSGTESFLGGLHFYWHGWPTTVGWPQVRLRLIGERVVIGPISSLFVWIPHIEFSRSELAIVERMRRGVRLVPTSREPVAFGSFRPDRLLNALESRGFRVDRSLHPTRWTSV
jgi:hypothetical protein